MLPAIVQMKVFGQEVTIPEKEQAVKSLDDGESANSDVSEEVKKLSDSIEWADIEKSLQSDNPMIRQAAAWKLAVDHPEAQTASKVIDTIVRALEDTDQLVNTYGIYAASRTAFIHKPKEFRRRNLSTPYDISKDKRVFPLLVNFLDCPNLQVRESVISTLSLAYDSQQELQQRLVSQFKKSAAPTEKAALLELMAEWKFRGSDEISLMIKSLQSQSDYLRDRAIYTLGRLAPKEAIEPLVKLYFLKDLQPSEREHLLRVLVNYSDVDLSAAIRQVAVTTNKTEIENLQENLQKAKIWREVQMP